MNDAQRAAIEGFVARAAAAQQVTIHDAALLSGGAIQQNWRLSARVEGGAHAGEALWVLRTDAPSAVSASHGRAQEYALLSAAAQAGVTVPQPLWLCEDRAVIGRPFFIMRCVAGTAAGHVLTRDGGPVSDREQLAMRLGHELALIHSIRPPRADLAFLPVNEEPPALHAIRRLRRDLDALPTAHPALEWGLRWLERQAPLRGELVLCHGDYRT
ncbi:phosphotransferase family protein, partial [Aquabacterium sp.]|uniref:phosphotransferase family protein n=1 Tax=Aquabacterium sp. TaxID=1872578 RepID=UPI002D1B75A4